MTSNQDEIRSDDDRVRIIANGEAHDVEGRNITILAHQGDVALQAPGRFEIVSPKTVDYAKALSQAKLDLLLEFGLADYFKLMFGEHPCPKTVQEIVQEGVGVQHAVGLIGLLLECAALGVPSFLRHPETHLHPKAQLGLADVLITLTGSALTGHEKANHHAQLAGLGRRLLEPIKRPKPDPAS